MNNMIYVASAFVAGAAIGGFIGYKYAQKTERKIAQEEIDSVRAVFTVPREEKVKKEDEVSEDKKLSDKALNKPSLIEYTKKLSTSKYVNYSNADGEKVEEKATKSKKKKPYVISPDEYGEIEEYDKISLVLYADGILADEDDTIIEAGEVVGDAIEHMGDYEDDAVHVCNPKRKVYYEILADERSYEDATGKDPHQNDGEED